MNGDIPYVPSDPKDSQIFGVSVRAWLAVMLVSTTCAMHVGALASKIYAGILAGALPDLSGQIVPEPLYGMSLMALGFYLGQKNKV